MSTWGWVLLGAAVVAIAIEAGVEQRAVNRRWREDRRRFMATISDYEAAERLRSHGQGVMGAPANPPVNQRRPGSVVELGGARGGDISGGSGNSTP